MDEQMERRIRARAHAIWEAEGRPEERDREHWMQAVRELTGEGRGDVPDAPGGTKDPAEEDHAQVVAPTPPQGR